MPHLLRLLDGVEVYLYHVVLQPANEQSAAVREQEAVHVLGVIHAAEAERGQKLGPSLPSWDCPLVPSCQGKALTGSQK